MDWQFAIRKNREALAGVVAGLAAMASLPLVGRDTKAACTSVRAGRSWVGVKSPDANTPTPDPSPQGGGETGRATNLPPPLHRAILHILRPAESALRRLIVVVAAMLCAKVQAGARTGKDAKRPLPDFASFARHDRLPSFALIDPRKRFGPAARPAGAGIPRISVPGITDGICLAKPGEPLDAAALLRRIRKLQYVLHTLPRQARRLNRLMARRATAKPGPGRAGPIRPGHPPGHRKRPRHPVDDILRDCHWLARQSGFKPP